MPRNIPPVPSTVRNRNRITNKSRLKIHVGAHFEAETVIPDEDEEKQRLQQSVAGVDTDDANEHHLQQVLSEAASRHANKVSQGTNKRETTSNAYIPTPDSNGLVANYEQLYPPRGWRDPSTFVFSSETCEDTVRNGLANGFSYYMDERDKEWLDKNNEEARGEGTSAQGTLLSPTGTRYSARSAKAKGKEPEIVQFALITEDEFELVMGLFEKVTHEKTEFLHHSLETGMAFPPFSDYEDIFATPLHPTFFASLYVPGWVPAPPKLTPMARAIYPYWKERRLERNGQRIIPTLNFDESDVTNESYVCFRRRELKAVRKTRAAQVTFSDKLARLQAEFAAPLEMAKIILHREKHKLGRHKAAHYIFQRRLELSVLKQRNQSLREHNDDDVMIDRERPRKDIRVRLDTSRSPGGVRHNVNSMRPRERTALYYANTEKELKLLRDRDHAMEDVVDYAYQPSSAYTSRLFKYIPTSAPDEGEEKTQPRAVRVRYGRGGRLMIDRRMPVLARRIQSLNAANDEARERQRSLEERWRFDSDDLPSHGPDGQDEDDRMLVDECDTKILRHTMGLLTQEDQTILLTTNNAIPRVRDGHMDMYKPYMLGQSLHPVIRAGRPYPGAQHPMISQAGQAALAQHLPNGSPIAITQQLKMQVNPQVMRISMPAGLRVNGISTLSTSSPHTSPPHPNGTGQIPNGVNDAPRPPIVVPQIDAVKADPSPMSIDEKPTQQIESQDTSQPLLVNGQSHFPPQSQPQPPLQVDMINQMSNVNGYHVSAPSNPSYVVTPTPNQFLSQPSTLTLSQMQSLKAVFASQAVPQDASALQVNGGRPLPASYVHNMQNNGVTFNSQLGIAANMKLHLPPGRQVQWPATSMQRPPSVNSVDGSPLMNGVVPINRNPSTGVPGPARSPSSNGSPPSRGGMHLMPSTHITHPLSPHLQHSPSPVPMIPSSSPQGLALNMPIMVSSPPMQHQQVLNGTQQNGY